MKRILYTLRRSRHVNYLSIIAMLIGGGATFGWFSFATESRTNRPVDLVIDDRPIQRDGTVPRSFADVVGNVAPSVVRVNTESKGIPSHNNVQGMSPHPFFDRFFDRRPSLPTPDLPTRQGLGSGVIISPDGYILTNNHVIQGAERIEIVLTEPEKSYEAKLVGGDPKSDLAVLKIDADGLPYTRIGDSDQIRVGDIVLAIGNPFGVGQTVTMGIVGATGRASIGLDYEDFIQTDAAINPGNSGGALIDIEGRLVGINTAILSKTGSHQGIGFAIPTNLARNVMEDLIEHGHVNRGFLGVMIQDVSPQLADYFDIPEGKGALIAEVTPSSPADDAGLETGDVIIQVNDTAIRDSRQLKLLIGANDPDSAHDFSILRDGKRKTVTVRLAELDDKSAQVARYSDSSNSDGTLDGVTVTDIDPRSRAEFQIPRRLRGALVVDVKRSSASWRAGLRPGDVVREINRERVESADEAVALSETIEDEIVLIRVWRKGSTLFLAVEESDLG